MPQLASYSQSSIGKKQIVAATGLMLILFVIGHLAGNLFIYGGPQALNGYADKLAHLRPALYVVEGGLGVLFIVHLTVTALLVWENAQARPIKYQVSHSVGERSLATRLMPVTGTIIVAFVVWHLLDFTFSNHEGPRSILADGKSYGLYGVVYNAFLDPVHAVLYIVVMCALGFHLSHGIQSFFQTFGFNHPHRTPVVRRISNFMGVLIALGYSSIPVAVQLGWIGVR